MISQIHMAHMAGGDLLMAATVTTSAFGREKREKGDMAFHCQNDTRCGARYQPIAVLQMQPPFTKEEPKQKKKFMVL